jgi:hypothetical protein
LKLLGYNVNIRDEFDPTVIISSIKEKIQ